MGFAEKDQNSEKMQYARLHSALEKLTKEKADEYLEQKRKNQEKPYLKVTSQQEALQYCEKAMQRLEKEYVQSMERFNDSTDLMICISALEEAEKIWQESTEVILHFNQGGEEQKFFNQVRLDVCKQLEKKLVFATEICEKSASPESVALCLSIIGTMDTIYAERGLPKDSEERQFLHKVGSGFLPKM